MVLGNTQVTGQVAEAAATRGESNAARITGTVLEVLSPRANPTRFVQGTIIEVLSTRNPCPFYPPTNWWLQETVTRRTHLFARLWTITRSDGQVFRFTDHCGALIDDDGETFTPVGGPATSAQEHEAGDREHTAEIKAAIIIGGAETDDLEANKWHDAVAIERVVNWRVPWMGCMRYHKWFLGNIQWDGEKWTADLGGYASRFRRPHGDVYSATTCGHDFGDAFGDDESFGCKFDVAATQLTGTVSAIIKPKRRFRATGLTAALSAEYFVAGILTWTAGDNAGIVSAVRVQVEGAGYYELEVELSLSEGVSIGDTFTIRKGCQKRAVEDCIPNGQILNFGGFPFMPGPDGIQGDIHP